MRVLGLATLVVSTACSGPSSSSPVTSPVTPSAPVSPAPAPPPTWNVDEQGIPPFITSDYIDLDAIARISRFRSGEGHSYTDDFETCRSMKHYFMPASGRDWSTVAIRAPLAGTIVEARPEWAGVQIAIRSRDYPPFVVVLFHVVPATTLEPGTPVESGERLGTHVGNQTWSDVAIRVETPAGLRLVSYFDALAPEVFDRYRARGLTSKADAVVSRAERDANPLACTGESFTNRGALPNWVQLR